MTALMPAVTVQDCDDTPPANVRKSCDRCYNMNVGCKGDGVNPWARCAKKGVKCDWPSAYAPRGFEKTGPPALMTSPILRAFTLLKMLSLFHHFPASLLSPAPLQSYCPTQTVMAGNQSMFIHAVWPITLPALLSVSPGRTASREDLDLNKLIETWERETLRRGICHAPGG